MDKKNFCQLKTINSLSYSWCILTTNVITAMFGLSFIIYFLFVSFVFHSFNSFPLPALLQLYCTVGFAGVFFWVLVYWFLLFLLVSALRITEHIFFIIMENHFHTLVRKQNFVVLEVSLLSPLYGMVVLCIMFTPTEYPNIQFICSYSQHYNLF